MITGRIIFDVTAIPKVSPDLYLLREGVTRKLTSYGYKFEIVYRVGVGAVFHGIWKIQQPLPSLKYELIFKYIKSKLYEFYEDWKLSVIVQIREDTT